jgi:hypothetical protein
LEELCVVFISGTINVDDENIDVSIAVTAADRVEVVSGVTMDVEVMVAAADNKGVILKLVM